METKDLLWRLISALTDRQKKRVRKYLDIFTDKKPLKIFDLYTSSKVYHEERFYRLSKIKTIGQFRTSKTALKEHVLDFLSLQMKDKKSIWRKRIGHGVYLREQGKELRDEAFNTLKKVMKDCFDEYQFTYSIQIRDELVEFQATSSHNVDEAYKLINTYYGQSVDNIYHSHYHDKFYMKVGHLGMKCMYVRSQEQEEILRDLAENEYLKFDYTNFIAPEDQIGLILITLLFYVVYGEYQIVWEQVQILEKWLQQPESQKHMAKKPFDRIGAYSALFFGYRACNRLADFGDHCNDLKLFLERLYPNPNVHAIYWSKYYDFFYSIKIVCKDTTEKDAKFLASFIAAHHEKLIPRITAILQVVLFNIYILNEKYADAQKIASTLFNHDAKDSSLKEYTEMARLLIIVCEVSSGEIEELSPLAESYYRYFSRKGKGYYEFEKVFCSFFKSLEQRNWRAALPILKEKMKQIEANDEFCRIRKINTNIFDFYRWIDTLTDEAA